MAERGTAGEEGTAHACDSGSGNSAGMDVSSKSALSSTAELGSLSSAQDTAHRRVDLGQQARVRWKKAGLAGCGGWHGSRAPTASEMSR